MEKAARRRLFSCRGFDGGDYFAADAAVEAEAESMAADAALMAALVAADAASPAAAAADAELSGAVVAGGVVVVVVVDDEVEVEGVVVDGVDGVTTVVSSFLPQAARAMAATRTASESDLFICILEFKRNRTSDRF